MSYPLSQSHLLIKRIFTSLKTVEEKKISKVGFFLLVFFFFILFFNFTILYCFCHISKWIRHRYTCVWSQIVERGKFCLFLIPKSFLLMEWDILKPFQMDDNKHQYCHRKFCSVQKWKTLNYKTAVIPLVQ